VTGPTLTQITCCDTTCGQGCCSCLLGCFNTWWACTPQPACSSMQSGASPDIHAMPEMDCMREKSHRGVWSVAARALGNVCAWQGTGLWYTLTG
jgi:hypothetical protein